MIQMRDSILDPRWLAEQVRVNPPQKLANGNIFCGIVRLAFPNLFKPRERKPGRDDDGSEGKFGATLLFPLGADLRVFQEAWMREAREAFPKNWINGQPSGLHIPFHDQAEKTIGVKPLMGYTPGAIYFATSSKFQPPVVDAHMNTMADEKRVYSGVWAFVAVNTYHYSNKKTGVGFGLQSVRIEADDTRLGGGGSDPRADFGGITITAAANIADKFASAPVLGATQTPGIMPAGGFVGNRGSLPVHPLPAGADDLY
jgi:Enterobacter phage Enc34, ssDNA-binding protein